MRHKGLGSERIDAYKFQKMLLEFKRLRPLKRHFLVLVNILW